jgi:hypothetical protein
VETRPDPLLPLPIPIDRPVPGQGSGEHPPDILSFGRSPSRPVGTFYAFGRADYRARVVTSPKPVALRLMSRDVGRDVGIPDRQPLNGLSRRD